MNRNILILGAVMLFAMATALLAVQRGGRGAAPLPAFYTGRNVSFGSVDTAAADRACQAARGHARLVCLADLLKKDLSPDLVSRLQIAYSATDAKRWSNLPPGPYNNRIGVTLGEFSPAQLGVVKAMLKAAAGVAADEGYDEIEQILNADDFLRGNGGGTNFASGNAHLAFVGTPAARGTWELYFGGHHQASGITYTDGVMAGATPSFRGVEPFSTFREAGRDNAPIQQERQAFVAMLAGLSPEQQAMARLEQTFTDLVAGAQRDDNIPSLHAGLRVGDLSQSQRDLVVRAIETYVRDIDAQDADAVLKKYRTELADTYIAYSGTLTMNAENDYVRIDGPSVWIELSMQPGRVLPGIHPHSIWRDRRTDYGGNK